jgi:GNAT superfamily N-acetyltransferase
MVGIDDNNFYVGQVSEDNACCMILQWSDTLFWPEAEEHESGYIHKSVRRDYSGMGLSHKMVEFAIEECRRRDVPYLRLDTGWGKYKLCNLYESLGFNLVGKSLLEDRGEFALFEMNMKEEII